jgi:putative hydrolase of the HAD superfamily
VSQPAIVAISLDLDDTLWPVWPAIERAERELHAYLGVQAPVAMAGVTIERMRELRDRLWLQHPEHAHDFSTLRRLSLRALLEPHGHGDDLVEAAFEVFYAARNRVTLYPDAGPALERLAAGFRLVSLTNGNADLVRIGLGHHFTAEFSARTIGAAKPDPRCFHAVAEALALPPGAIAHVGDDPLLDVEGARRAGFLAVWLNRRGEQWPHAEPPDLEIATLAELAPALDSINRSRRPAA